MQMQRRLLCGRIASYGNPNGGNEGRKLGSAILRAKPSCPCTGEGASLKETEFGAEPKVRPPRAASRSIPGDHRSQLLIRSG
ncbi:hypothetical protein CK203_088693 [Vitis vinifera]|uniref:Uncharacterized protein n=1 Tax=Vitis vinifera TaxID=29760 RepID=A0A438D423_VITVI|nr:hypothetical protein CK203_088693 [Vitis vinifera]